MQTLDNKSFVLVNNSTARHGPSSRPHYVIFYLVYEVIRSE